jgi:hypothetical protein
VKLPAQRIRRSILQDFSPRMRLPNTAHTSRPWRIHELTADFRLEDVWALPTPGGPDDFPRLVQLMASADPSRGSSRVARTLWALRWKLGKLLGWDGPDHGHGPTRPTLRSRLPADLRDGPAGPDFGALPFTSLYLLENEFPVLRRGCVENHRAIVRAARAQARAASTGEGARPLNEASRS